MIAKEVTRTRWVSMDDSSCVLRIGKSGLPAVQLADGRSEWAVAFIDKLYRLHHEEALRSVFVSLVASLTPLVQSDGFTVELNGKNALDHAELFRWVWGDPEARVTVQAGAGKHIDVCFAATKEVPALTSGYGCIGQMFQDYVSRNEQAARELLDGLRSKYFLFGLVSGGSDIAALVVGAILLAKSAGIHNIDVRTFQFAIIGALTRVDDKIRRNDRAVRAIPPAPLWRMLGDLRHNTLVTESQKHTGELPTLRGFLSGRAIEDVDKLMLGKVAVTKWCEANGVIVADIERAAAESGCLITPDARENIGRGTPMQTGQVRCYVFRWSKVKGQLDAATT